MSNYIKSKESHKYNKKSRNNNNKYLQRLSHILKHNHWSKDLEVH